MPFLIVDHHVVLAALLIDAVVGDPPWLYRRIPHPVVLIGNLVASADRLLNQGRPTARFAAGLITVFMIVGASMAAAVGVQHYVSAPFAYGWLLEACIASTLIAFRGLFDHVRAVALGLAESLERGRAAVRHVVGRDPDSLDAAGVARAAIESAAENFSDGVVAPVFWYALLGLPGLFGYKAINTLDSMIGNRGERHRYFGTAAARIDDVVNYVPARLAGLLLVVAAALMPRASARAALRTMLRDAPKHRSPNAGWQEAAVAGALDLALAGPRRYPHEVVDDAWMGDGRTDLGEKDIHACLSLYLIAGGLLASALLVSSALA